MAEVEAWSEGAGMVGRSFSSGSEPHALGHYSSPFPAPEAEPLGVADQADRGQAAAGRRTGPGGGRVGVTVRHVTCGASGHGGKRTTQRRRLPSAAPQRLGPLGGGHPQRLEELLAVGGQGAGSAEHVPRGGGWRGQYSNTAAGERRRPPRRTKRPGGEGRLA